MPGSVAAYDAKLVERLSALLGPRLVAVYATGSTALGDYVPGASDVDRLVAVEGGLAGGEADAIAAALAHERLPCPGRALELVVYAREALARPAPGAAFALNLNTGAGLPLRAVTDPEAEPAHWFVLDRALARDRAIPLLGPPAASLLAPLPRASILEALAASLRWHAENPETAGPNAVLNACRAWHWLAEGRWVSKREAAEWARARDPSLAVATAAGALRLGESDVPLDPAAVDALTARVYRLVAEARASAP